jgi:hypothetical protein
VFCIPGKVNQYRQTKKFSSLRKSWQVEAKLVIASDVVQLFKIAERADKIRQAEQPHDQWIRIDFDGEEGLKNNSDEPVVVNPIKCAGKISPERISVKVND